MTEPIPTPKGCREQARLFQSRITGLWAFLRYNASNVFAGKFIYFLSMAIVLFLVIVIIYVAGHETSPDERNVYYFLLVPGVLLVFYPSAYSIQGDIDSRMLETLFGIPDYRYKVWLSRSVTQYLVIGVFLFVLALLCRLGLADFPLWSMMFHLMFPIVFLGSFGFMTAVVTRSGNSTAVVLVISILFFWMASGSLEGSSWDLFHNPFGYSEGVSVMFWEEVTLYNRVYMLLGALVSTMFGLLRLQKREKFF